MPTPFQNAAAASVAASERARAQAFGLDEVDPGVQAQIALAEAELAKALAIRDGAEMVAQSISRLAQALQR